MIHQYKLNGYNIVLDVCSGGVHFVDDVAYDIIEMYEGFSREEIIEKVKKVLKEDESMIRFVGTDTNGEVEVFVYVTANQDDEDGNLIYARVSDKIFLDTVDPTTTAPELEEMSYDLKLTVHNKQEDNVRKNHTPETFFYRGGRFLIHGTQLFQEKQHDGTQKQEPQKSRSNGRNSAKRTKQRCNRTHIDAEKRGISEHNKQLFKHFAFSKEKKKQVLSDKRRKETNKESNSPRQSR